MFMAKITELWLEIVLMKLENKQTYCRLPEVVYLQEVIIFFQGIRKGHLNTISYAKCLN